MRRWHFIASGVLVAILLCIGTTARFAIAQPSKPSTVLVLRDPTTRPAELDKVYQNADPTGKAPNPQQLAAYNQKL